MKKETIRNVAGVFLFYMLIILGVVAINARIGTINEGVTSVSLGN